MNILVTGANGQLGKCLRDIVYKKGNGEPHANVGDKDYWIFAGREELDVEDTDAVRKYISNNFISIVVNCAAYTNVGKAEENKDAADRGNRLAVANLATACSRVGAVLIHISTDYVFDGKKNTPYVPEDGCMPLNVYGMSKYEGENEIKMSGCKYLIFRTSWLYSEYGNNFVKTMVKRSLADEESSVVFDQVGCPTYAGDLARFIYHIITDNNAENRYLSKTGVYHYCNKGIASWYDLAHSVYLNTGDPEKVSCKRTPMDEKVKRPTYSVMDTSLTEQIFDTKIPHWDYSLTYAIKRVISKIEDDR